MIVENFFILKRDELCGTVNALENIGFGKKIEPLLDQLWKFGLPFVNDMLGDTYRRTEFKEATGTVSGWRDVIAVERRKGARLDKEVHKIAAKVRNEITAGQPGLAQKMGRLSPRQKP